MKMPMVADCRETRESLSELADGELDPRRRRRVERHLAMCRRCRAVWEALQATLAGLRSLGVVELEPRPALATEVARRLRAERDGGSP